MAGDIFDQVDAKFSSKKQRPPAPQAGDMFDQVEANFSGVAKRRPAPPSKEDTRPELGYKTGQLLRGVEDVPNALLAVGPNLINLARASTALGPMAYDAITGGTAAGELYSKYYPGGDTPLMEPARISAVDDSLNVADPTSYGDKLLGAGVRAAPFILAGGGVPTGVRQVAGNLALGGTGAAIGQGVTDATDSPLLGLLASVMTPMAFNAAKGRMGVLTEAGRTRKLGSQVTDDLASAKVPVDKAVAALRNPAAVVPGATPLTGSILEETLPAHGPRLMSQVTSALSREATPEGSAVTQALERNASARAANIGAEGARAVPGEARPQMASSMAQQHETKVAHLETKAAEKAAEAERIIATRDTGPAASQAMLGTTIGQKLEDMATAISGRFSKVFKPEVVDPSGKSRALIPRNFQEDVAAFYNKHTALIPEELQGSASKIAKVLNDVDPLPPPKGGGTNPYTGVKIPKAPVPTEFNVPYADLKVIRTYLTDTLRRVGAGPNPDKAAANGLVKLIAMVDDGVKNGAKAGKFDPVAAARYEKARTDYKGEIGQVRDFIPGEVLARNRQGSPMWQATPEQVAAKFLAKQSSVEQLLKLFGKDPAVMKAVADHLKARWAAAVAPGGTPGAAWEKAHFKFMRDNRTALDALPSVKADLLKAQKDAAHALSESKKLLGKADTFRAESPTRFFANRNDPEVQLDALLSANTRQADLPALVNRVKADPALHAQTMTALVNHMADVAKGGAGKLAAFLELPANQSLIKGVYGADALARLKAVARDAHRDAKLLEHTPARLGRTPVSGSMLRSAISAAAHRPSLAADQAGQALMRGPLVSGNKAMQRLYAEAATKPNVMADILEQFNAPLYSRILQGLNNVPATSAAAQGTESLPNRRKKDE